MLPFATIWLDLDGIYTCECCCFSHVQLFVTLWIVVCQTPLPMGFSRQEYWNGLPCPPPGDLPYPGMGVLLHWQVGS